MITLWHNPRCSKSRQALALLENAGHEVTVRHYLENPPSRAEIDAVLVQLGMTAKELMRRGETAFKEQRLAAVSDEDALRDAMVAVPILIERPIAMRAGKAVLGRPPENVLKLPD